MTVQLVVVMGVAGAGKTTIGEAIAASLGWPFQDADPLHPRRNIARMATGHALTDADRAPWLTTLRHWVRTRLNSGAHGVLACSLLKRGYRARVIGGDRRVALIYLHATPRLLARRLRARRGHFMHTDMLASQLATLEPPGSLEGACHIDVAGTPQHSLAKALKKARGSAPGAEPLAFRYRYPPRSPGWPVPE